MDGVACAALWVVVHAMDDIRGERPTHNKHVAPCWTAFKTTACHFALVSLQIVDMNGEPAMPRWSMCIGV